MSFVITMWVREGIVMASDSRLTLNTTVPSGEKQVIQVAVGMSDSSYKTFLTPNGVGISTFGAADIGGVPLTGYIESFINENLTSTSVPVEQIPRMLSDYFCRFSLPPDTHFHVAGYKSEGGTFEQQIWNVSVARAQINRLNPPGEQGVSWGGEGDILSRLLQNVIVISANGEAQELPHFQIPYQFFTLQDAVDFCVFAVRSTIDAIRFQPRAKTVGGPIDVVVIKPDEAFWIQRKQLTIPSYGG